MGDIGDAPAPTPAAAAPRAWSPSPETRAWSRRTHAAPLLAGAMLLSPSRTDPDLDPARADTADRSVAARRRTWEILIEEHCTARDATRHGGPREAAAAATARRLKYETFPRSTDDQEGETGCCGGWLRRPPSR